MYSLSYSGYRTRHKEQMESVRETSTALRARASKHNYLLPRTRAAKKEVAVEEEEKTAEPIMEEREVFNQDETFDANFSTSSQ